MRRNEKIKQNLDEVDICVGKNLKLYRIASGLSQDKLASKVGITFQQIQKYENGSNRISASRMYDLAKILNVNVGDFFKGLDDNSNVTDFYDKMRKNLGGGKMETGDRRGNA